MEKITKKQLKKRYKDFMTVGKLKEFIKEHNVPDDAKILIQRVEDVYFEGVDISGCGGGPNGKPYPKGSKTSGWPVYLKKDEHYYSAIDLNRRMRQEIKRRKSGKKPKYDMKDPSKYIVKITDDLKTQYVPCWCPRWYKDDIKDFLFIDLHY